MELVLNSKLTYNKPRNNKNVLYKESSQIHILMLFRKHITNLCRWRKFSCLPEIIALIPVCRENHLRNINCNHILSPGRF